MLKKTTLLAALLFSLSQAAVFAQTSKQVTADASKTSYKFLDNISVEPVAEEQWAPVRMVAVPSAKKDLLLAAKKADSDVETAGSLQFKYSQLLDVEVETIKNTQLLRVIDDWYGIKYLYGGETKKGIDCSALMQVFFTALYGISLPRTAKMQYDFSRRISRTELKEGDLLFFNTRGGVSHVGMYLQNNKFVHASVKGVAISDMFEPYYASRLIGTGRILENGQPISASILPKP
ncbi:MAG TPA: C40 family peptidase [Flavisolibacter sp.]|nr:C40 family peptidase [Flavisolibacter sp.]